MSRYTQPATLSPKEAAGRFAAPAKRNGFKPEAMHSYTDTEGEAIYWRIRAKDPATGAKWIRPMHLTVEGYALGEPAFPDGKPLYRLHELAKNPDAPVVVVEGEWAADHLAAVGVLACTSGAADSARAAQWRHLAGRDVLIWPDNDEAGARYGDEVASLLVALGCRVRVVDAAVLGLPRKGDAVDWLAAHPDATAGDVLALPELPPDAPGNPSDFNDMASLVGADAVARVIGKAAAGGAAVVGGGALQESTPKPLPSDLLPVEPFRLGALPESFRPWVSDVSERMNCPPDYVAVPLLVAAAAMVARRVGIRPEALTDWQVPGNLWAVVVGRPGVMKSPAMAQALAPIVKRHEDLTP